MAFGDDLEDMGFDLSASPKEAVLIFRLSNDFGEEVEFQKELPDEDAMRMLYIVAADTTLHAHFLGHGVDGRRYYRFVMDREYEDISSVKHELIDGDWVVTHDRKEGSTDA